MAIPFTKKIQLFIADQTMNFINLLLFIFQKILFSKKGDFKNILVYKVGNIGDIICAIPSFIAIRRAYPNAKITLLTSPGKVNMSGAKEILNGVWYFDEIKAYYADDISSFKKKVEFVKKMRSQKYDLFIQFPDEIAGPKSLLRNMIFAKILGVKSAFGFKIRAIRLFKKTQVDYREVKTEVERLLEILKENGVNSFKVEYDFKISDAISEKINKMCEKFENSGNIIVAVCPGGKKASNLWPGDRFKSVLDYLKQKYNARVIVVGGKNDVEKANYITSGLGNGEFIIAIGSEILESIEIFKKCDFLISNDTGAAHMAAAVGLPAAVIFNVRSPLNTWVPYGQNHKILYHKFIDCDYNNEDCIKRSVEAVTVDEVKTACDQIISKINTKQF